MDSNKRSVLQKELELYSGVLKKYENIKRNQDSTSTSVYQLYKNSSSKQLTLSAYNMIKNSTQHLTSKYPYNKYQQSCVRNQNIRTVSPNDTNHFKSKYKLTSNKTARNIPFKEGSCQKIVSNKYSVNQYKKPDLFIGSSSTEVPKLPHTSVSSESLALIREIESLTKELKKTSESKSKAINAATKDCGNILDKPYSCKSSSSNFKYHAFSKCNVLKDKDIFSKINNPNKNQFKIICSNMNSSVGVRKKLSGIHQANFVPGNKSKSISSLTYPNSFNLDKYCYRKVNTKKVLNSKATCTSLKPIDNEKNSKDNIQNNISKSPLNKVTSKDLKSVAGNFSHGSGKLQKSLNQDSKLKTNLDVTVETVISVTKTNDKYPSAILKSQNMHKSSNVPKINGANSKYKRVNANHSVISNKHFGLKNASHLRCSSTKRTKGKVNTKFKIINKTVTPCTNKKVVTEKSNFGCKESSPLTVEKSDPLFKFLNDSTIDKLEQDLLALSTTLTATPTSGKSEHKGLQTKPRKVSPKFNHKKMSLKKCKGRISKYKVINSVASHSSAINNRCNFINLKNVKKVRSKFSIINKHILPLHVTPVQRGKSVLIKRLFKSKNAIINKNATSSYHSAKMIKYKYFALNKRKLPYEKSVSYSNLPLLQPKFKGYLSAKHYSKKSRYQKPSALAYSQRPMRRSFSHYGCNFHSSLFSKSISGNNSVKKLHHRYGHSPVVFIQGHKYSLNASGKTLRKLPAQDFSKIHQKVFVNGKRCSKFPEKKMKSIAPTSANLASRVLHRSITRVLSASSKKRLIKVNSYCMFYNRFGRCNRGIKCTYIHDPSKIAVCTRFLRGTCKADGCPFSHEVAPGKMAICSFFLVGACDKDDCPYRHENLSPDAELCKAFVQGYCPSGKECKKAHILICPKYIQGNCEKGTSCAFPHPPQKARKNGQKEIDEENVQDALLEKVARYFQPNENKSDDNIATNVFVPKQRRLEEQPSFIPLFGSPAPLNNGYKDS